MDRNELIFCFRDTVRKSEEGMLGQNTKQAIKSNKVYKEEFRSKLQKKNESASIAVETNTTFNAAKKYCDYGKVAVLNFANPKTPGGGVQHGAMAQEECLCRSSNLYHCLSDENVFKDYYLYHQDLRSYFFSDRVIYTEGVLVFKDDNIVPQDIPEKEWFTVDVITCAAPYLGMQTTINTAILLDVFKKRIKNIFEAARDNEVDILVLGAFGCGAFKNPPEVVAEAFHQVIYENNYCLDFKHIVFAIKPTGENCPNLKAFSEIFKKYERDNSEFALWQQKNTYFGKKFSILGDSISTFEGSNPSGYAVFYREDNCVKTNVTQIGDTWWDKVIGFLGGELLVNNSWSGSRVTKLPGAMEVFPSGCSDERTSSLHIDGVEPDIIIIYLGTYDWGNGVRNSTDIRLLGEDDNNLFDLAYENMIGKLRKNYPQSEIWCCTLCETYISNVKEFKFPHKYAGTHMEVYNEIIKKIAVSNQCKVIDLYNFNIPYDSIDGSHPTQFGMDIIAKLVIRSVVSDEVLRYIECEERVPWIIEKGYSMLPTRVSNDHSSNTLRLTIERRKKTVQFKQDTVKVGRNSDCDLLIKGKKNISRNHATFFYERNTWFLRDNYSTNGTWLNGVKMQPGIKYQLAENNKIDFAKSETVYFYKTQKKGILGNLFRKK